MRREPEDGAVAARVRAALAAVPRVDFLPRARRRDAAFDGPLDIGHGQTNSQPRTVADMLRLLDVRPGDRVLDVGAGSGWTTALLARLTGPSGSVLGVERVPELVAFGAANLDRAGMPWARLVAARPGVLGSPEDGPFDRVLVSAAPRTLPPALVAQLRDGGVLVIPVDGTMTRLVRHVGGADTITRHGAYRFVPLVTDDPPPP